MRVSTGMIYDAGLASMQKRTSSMLNTQQQLSSGRRILKPSDDPVAAARALEVTQSQEVNANQATTRDNAKSTLGIIDGQLDSAGDLMVRVRELAVQAGSASLSAADRRSIASELRARFEEMVALANARDGTGLFLFGGYQTSNQPFAGSVESGVVYGGDDGARTLRVSASRDLPVSDSGNDVFMRIKNGNGTFVTGVQNDKPTNATHVTYEGATLTNPPATTGSYELRFWTDTAGTVKTSAQAVGTVNPNAAPAGSGFLPYTFVTGGGPGTDNPIDITIDGGATISVDLATALGGPTYNDADAIVTAIQDAIDTAGGGATVSLDTAGQLVITSTNTGATPPPAATIALADGGGGGNDSLAALFGVPGITNGVDGPAGATYFDVVNSSGVSLFTNTASASGGSANTYTHLYQSGTAIDLSSAGPFAFDFGADAVLTGNPADGDAFTLVRDATTLTLTGKTFNANGARATIDNGTVTDPVKWAQSGNSGNLEVRFWVDPTGSVGTSGRATGAVDLSTLVPVTVVAGTSDQFTINVDGAGVRTVTIPPGTYTTAADMAASVQTGIEALAAPPVAARVTLNAGNNLVVTSVATGVSSTVALAAGAGARDALAPFFGVPVSAGGAAAGGAAGTTYYDLVDASTGNSLFSGGTSSAGGAGNTYTHVYDAGSRITLASAGGAAAQTFDYGASISVSGIPAGGDVFTIEASDDTTFGNGYFVTDAKTGTSVNTGSGIVGAGEVRDPAKWASELNSRNLEIRFWSDTSVTPAVLYYDLVDRETEKSLFTDGTSTRGGGANTYTHTFKAGDSISFSGLHSAYGNGSAGDFGISVGISGTPADGDTFKVQPSESESAFDTMSRLITALESGAPAGTIGNTHLSNELASVLTSVSQIEDNFLRVRASIGSRLAEIDDLDSVGQDLDLQYSETLSRLQDLDYADAITRLTRQQMELQAAQQSFAKVSQLSLFDYL